MLRSLDWKFIVMLLTTVGGVLVPVSLWQFDQLAKSIRVQLISVTAMRPLETPTVDGLRLTLDGQELTEPYVSVIELTNDGSRAIPQGDYESPIEISTNSPAKVVRVELASKTPADIKPILAINNGLIAIQPLTAAIAEPKGCNSINGDINRGQTKV